MQSNDRIRIITEVGKTLLLFETPSKSDSGVYECESTFQNSEEYKAKKEINFFQNIEWENCPVVQSLIKGNVDESINCKVAATPSAQLTWTKGNKIIDQQRYVTENDKLKLRHPVSEEDGGEYQVSAFVQDTGKFEFRTITVNVLIPPKINDFKDQIEGTEGEKLEANCEASGNPHPTITWYDPKRRDLSNVGGYIVDRNTGQLTIIKANKEVDNGYFQCVAENPAGRDEKSLKVEIKEKPRIEAFTNITADEGKEAVFECQATGAPLPKLYIRKESMAPNDYLIEDGKHQFENSTDNSKTTLKMIINNIRRSDGGLYFCAAENSAGKAEQVGHLLVQFAPDLNKTIKEVKTWETRPVNLTCVVEAVPNASVSWYFGDRDLTEGNFNQYRVYNDPLGHNRLLVQPDNTVYGKYWCKAENSLGTKSIDIKLTQAFIPDPPDQIEFKNSTPTSIRFVIREVVDGGMPILGFYVTYQKKNDPLPSEPVYFDTPYTGENTLSGLQPDSEYDLKFALKNAVGNGDYSRIFSQRTAVESPPTIPKFVYDQDLNRPGVDVVTSSYSTRYDVRFNPSEGNGREVEGYVLKYYEVVRANDNGNQSPKSHWKKAEHVDPKEAFIGAKDSTSYSLTDLKPGTYYRVELSARNAIGDSNPSYLVLQTKNSNGEENVKQDGAVTRSSSKLGLILLIVLFIVIISLIIMDVIFYIRCRVGLLYLFRTRLCIRESSSSDSKEKGDETIPSGKREDVDKKPEVVIGKDNAVG
ncbi:Fasciclin-2-like protein [Dinothrombium tinctorium]|uniref:Fasciclin-2-like protein n=1 Tax=Dinothrombium tinctorium TaxID=1965070 RepID=A0A3S3S295_9ACAR|nr:Fasciclin-2-like protein [Dinothrombium tinctorium]